MTSMIGSWQYEATGKLRPAVKAYLLGHDELSAEYLDLLRCYLRSWMMGPWEPSEAVGTLRAAIEEIDSRRTLDVWTRAAGGLEIDPW